MYLLTQESVMGQQITFRNSKIVYYGPHTCENCGAMIVKMGTEWGGTAFTNPNGPIYPNTEWHPHVCDQKLVHQRKGMCAASRVTEDFPLANAVLLNGMGFVILGEQLHNNEQSGAYLVVSANQTFATTEDAAWTSALERLQNGWPTWQLDLRKYGVHAKLSADPHSTQYDKASIVR
jgi:hypothetical protein